MPRPLLQPDLDPAVKDLPVITLLEQAGPEVRPMVFRPVPPGRFPMGSRGADRDEEPRHRVEITPLRDSRGRPLSGLPAFWMAETPVTQSQFALWTGTGDYRRWLEERGDDYGLSSPHSNHFRAGDDLSHRPAENLSWREADAYGAWLAGFQKEVLGIQARAAGLPEELGPLLPALPAEARWEYACRAGTTTDYHTGDGEAALAEAGWFYGNSEGRTRAVGGRAANGWGLHDMHGNVWEWCLDGYDADAYRARPDGAADPVVGGSGAGNRVVRGGSWGSWAGGCRSANRFGGHPGFRDRDRGFRLCLLPGPVVAKERQQAGAEPDAPERAGGEGAGGTTARSLPASGGAPSGDPWENLRGPPAESVE